MKMQSNATNELFPAIFRARQKFVKVLKDKVNGGAGKGKYATLDSVLDTVTPPLESEMLMIEQSMTEESNSKEIRVITTIRHVSGQFISYLAVLPVVKADPQGMGSAFTYARRYGLVAALGLSQADDDAQIAVMSARDWKKRLDKCESMEDLAEQFKKAWGASNPIDKPIIQEHYEKCKASLTVGAGGGFTAVQKKAVNKGKDEVKSEPETKKQPEPQNIESFD
ncbi:recombinase [Enterobacter phage Phc]|nr:recombinase [Enterobacter phage Phc]